MRGHNPDMNDRQLLQQRSVRQPAVFVLGVLMGLVVVSPVFAATTTGVAGWHWVLSLAAAALMIAALGLVVRGRHERRPIRIEVRRVERTRQDTTAR